MGIVNIKTGLGHNAFKKTMLTQAWQRRVIEPVDFFIILDIYP